MNTKNINLNDHITFIYNNKKRDVIVEKINKSKLNNSIYVVCQDFNTKQYKTFKFNHMKYVRKVNK